MGADYISWPDLVDTIGEDAARVMCGTWGGTTKYVPKEHAAGDLARTVGERAAIELAARFGGTTLLLPNPKERSKTRILHLLAAGWSVRRIAMELHVTETWIRTVAKYAPRRQTVKMLPIRCP